MIDLENMDLDKMTGVTLGTPKFIKYTEAKDGDVLVAGIYKGDFPNKFNADKPNHKFEIKGRQIIILPAAGQLDYYISENILEGDLVRVTYLGQEEMEKGTYKGKKANKFNVELLLEGARTSDIPEVVPVKVKEVDIKEPTINKSEDNIDNLE